MTIDAYGKRGGAGTTTGGGGTRQGGLRVPLREVLCAEPYAAADVQGGPHGGGADLGPVPLHRVQDATPQPLLRRLRAQLSPLRVPW